MVVVTDTVAVGDDCQENFGSGNVATPLVLSSLIFLTVLLWLIVRNKTTLENAASDIYLD